MCLRPIRLPSQVKVKCKCCSWCKGNRVNDWAGRCVAEQLVSASVVSITLTYASLPPNADLDSLYPDVQRMLKRLRFAGYSVRYLCCGEYGEAKGRPHWHIILFFRGKAPEIERDTKFYNWKYWPHGYSYVQAPDFEGMCYVLKYSLKDNANDPRALKRIVMSRFPPIGAEYFQDLAQRLVDARLAVHSPEYAFGHLFLRSGKRRTFWLADRSLELFLSAYVSKWVRDVGSDPPMTPFLVEQFYDPIAKAEREASEFDERVSALERFGAAAFFLLSNPRAGVICVYPDGKAFLTVEGEEWRRDIGVGSVIGDLTAVGYPMVEAAGARSWLLGQIDRLSGPRLVGS